HRAAPRPGPHRSREAPPRAATARAVTAPRAAPPRPRVLPARADPGAGEGVATVGPRTSRGGPYHPGRATVPLLARRRLPGTERLDLIRRAALALRRSAVEGARL